MAWSQVRKTVAEIRVTPDKLVLFCGMSIGYEDVTVGYTRTGGPRSMRRSHSSTVSPGTACARVVTSLMVVRMQSATWVIPSLSGQVAR